MFEKAAQKLDNAAILGMLGTLEREFSFDLTSRGHSDKEADSLARQIILESMRAANVNINDYYSVKSWAKTFRHENFRAKESWGSKGRILPVYGAIMVCLWGGLAALGWHFSKILFYVGLPLWVLGVTVGLRAIINGVMNTTEGQHE